MTRSDIILAKVQAETSDDKGILIEALHCKIEEVYTIMFVLEKKDDSLVDCATVGNLLRAALES
jgi:hypothetical protein